MSIFPFQFIEDFILSGSNEDDNSEAASRDESSNQSDSVMLSGMSTDSTTDLTLVDPPTLEPPDSPTPSLGDHGAAIMPTGMFVELYRERFAQIHLSSDDDVSEVSEFGGTIVSSAPSETQIGPPPFESSWDVTSPPCPIHNENPSISSLSTTESMYRELASVEQLLLDEDDRSVDTSSSLSLRPSMVESTELESTCSAPSTKGGRNARTHERTAYLDVGNRLTLQTISEDQNEWFAHFSEQDWLVFRHDAEMILKAMDPSAASSFCLPPAPPSVEGTTTIGPYDAGCLPQPFICGLCHDVIVGATTLTCACLQSTVCIACWELNMTSIVDNEDYAELDNLVVRDHDRKCPFCDKAVSSAIPCHALDVAVLQCVKSLPDIHSSLQAAYYRRLAAWREEVQRRRGTGSNETQQHEQILAELIRREEEFFEERNEKRKTGCHPHRGLLLAGEIALLAAGVALFGVARALLLAWRR